MQNITPCYPDGWADAGKFQIEEPLVQFFCHERKNIYVQNEYTYFIAGITTSNVIESSEVPTTSKCEKSLQNMQVDSLGSQG